MSAPLPLVAPPSIEALLQSLPLRAAIVTDLEGAVLLSAGADAASDLGLQRMAATFATTAEHANKLGMGKSQHATAFYEQATVVHLSCAPLVLTLLADADASAGLLLDAAPELASAIEPLRAAVERMSVRGTI